MFNYSLSRTLNLVISSCNCATPLKSVIACGSTAIIIAFDNELVNCRVSAFCCGVFLCLVPQEQVLEKIKGVIKELQIIFRLPAPGQHNIILFLISSTIEHEFSPIYSHC